MMMKGQPNRDSNPVPPSQVSNHATDCANKAGSCLIVPCKKKLQKYHLSISQLALDSVYIEDSSKILIEILLQYVLNRTVFLQH